MYNLLYLLILSREANTTNVEFLIKKRETEIFTLNNCLLILSEVYNANDMIQTKGSWYINKICYVIRQTYFPDGLDN